MSRVLLTDYAWPDDALERAVIEGAGHQLVTGPQAPGDAEAITALVRAHRPAAILTCWAPVRAAAMAEAPDLRVVTRLGVGLDNIDVADAAARGVWVTNVPDYCVEEVSDHAVAMLLAWTRGLVAFDRDVKAGAWAPAGARLRRLADLTVGVFGQGRIGGRTLDKLRPWGARLLAHSRTPAAPTGVEWVSFEALLAQSDAVVIQAPLTPQTHHRFDRAALAAMKPGALLINVSRGPIVDNDALIEALEAGRLAGAALDVVEGEPSPPRRLVDRADVIVTPHVAFSSDASIADLRRRAAQEVVRVLGGEAPRQPCNAPAGLEPTS